MIFYIIITWLTIGVIILLINMDEMLNTIDSMDKTPEEKTASFMFIMAFTIVVWPVVIYQIYIRKDET